ncbi:unannotated protein [freshwater metagenome]|uniref:Unannotated protein n=1 Tax=freshwater metagenome TaxID=449393 RepID=A0A6J6XD85_9ZZZZ
MRSGPASLLKPALIAALSEVSASFTGFAGDAICNSIDEAPFDRLPQAARPMVLTPAAAADRAKNRRRLIGCDT